MTFGKSLAGGRVVPQMDVDRVAPAIGGGDLGNRAIDGTNAAAATWCDLDDGVFGDRADRFALANLGIMGAAVDRLDDDIMTVGIFIGQAALDDTADKRTGISGGRVID